jgi:hypothetical protein
MGVMQFGFDDAEAVVNTELPVFLQSASERKSRISVISFKSHVQVWIDKFVAENKALPSTDEINEQRKKIDEKLADHLKKPVDELTEVDRLNIQVPAFASAMVHYKQGVGSVQCLSKWEKGSRVTNEICCDRMDEPKQKIGCAIAHYVGLDENLDPNMDVLRLKQGLKFNAWMMNPSKYTSVKVSYNDGRRQLREMEENTGKKLPAVFDLRCELDGDPKFQNQKLSHMGCKWAHSTVPKEVQNFVLAQGLKIFKMLEKGNKQMGYEISKEKLAEKLSSGSSSSGSSQDTADKPQLNSNYDELI